MQSTVLEVGRGKPHSAKGSPHLTVRKTSLILPLRFSLLSG